MFDGNGDDNEGEADGGDRPRRGLFQGTPTGSASGHAATLSSCDTRVGELKKLLGRDSIACHPTTYTEEWEGESVCTCVWLRMLYLNMCWMDSSRRDTGDIRRLQWVAVSFHEGSAVRRMVKETISVKVNCGSSAPATTSTPEAIFEALRWSRQLPWNCRTSFDCKMKFLSSSLGWVARRGKINCWLLCM